MIEDPRAPYASVGIRKVGRETSLAALATGYLRSRPGQHAPLTRHAYAGVYRAFVAFVGAGAGPEALNRDNVRAYRDELAAAGRSPATVAKHLSALRALARELDAHDVHAVRGQAACHGRPRALSPEQYALLLRMPDLRAPAGRRDLAILRLLGTAGLRRTEAADLLMGDVEEYPDARASRLRQAISHSTSWGVTISYGARVRRVPLEQAALDAIDAWVRVRPACAYNELILSLPPKGRRSRPLSVRDITRVVTRWAELAGLPANLCSPHALRDTFCTELADRGVAIDVIRELAGHAEIRTTARYAAVHDN